MNKIDQEREMDRNQREVSKIVDTLDLGNNILEFGDDNQKEYIEENVKLSE